MVNNNNYDLEGRTAKFGEDVIGFIKSVKRNSLNDSILKQLIRSATSVGANYLPRQIKTLLCIIFISYKV